MLSDAYLMYFKGNSVYWILNILDFKQMQNNICSLEKSAVYSSSFEKKLVGWYL